MLTFLSFQPTQPKPLSIHDGDGGMRGAFRRPTAGGAACRIPNQSLGQISIKPKLLSFKILGLDLRITPSLSLPRAMHIPPGRPQDYRLIALALTFFVFFAFQKIFQNLLRKNDAKSAKIKDFGLPKPSQNPSKTLPKMQSQQTCDFSTIFARKSLCRESADIDFV